MPLDRYRKETLPASADSAVSRNLDALARLSESLERVPFLDGELLEGVAYSGSAVTVRHGLLRKWTGILVLSRDATETVAATDADNPEADKATFITFTASGTVTFDAWVF